MTQLTLPSPAKLNLFLHINGRLPNGYHELQSLFHFLDYGDTLTFELQPDPDIELSCNLIELETEDNLIVKAARALQTTLCAKASNPGVKIQLEKRLPMGGGVGGGSSNAATTLLALNKLWQLELSLSELEAIGNKLGADVPIFVRGQTSIAEGTGEQLFPYPIEERWYLVLTPNIHVSTALLFGSPDLPRSTVKLAHQDIRYRGIRDDLGNDFEQLVYKNYPVIAKARDWLLEYAPSRMTGTGACIFAEFSTQQQATEIFHQLPEHLAGFVAKGCNRSPTHRVLFG